MSILTRGDRFRSTHGEPLRYRLRRTQSRVRLLSARVGILNIGAADLLA